MQIQIVMWALPQLDRLVERLRSERGQGMTEYAVLLAFVAVVATIFALTTGLGAAIKTAVDGAATAIGNVG